MAENWKKVKAILRSIYLDLEKAWEQWALIKTACPQQGNRIKEKRDSR